MATDWTQTVRRRVTASCRRPPPLHL